MSAKVSPQVQEFLRARGLLGSLDEMLKRAARTSHPAGNRRYHSLVFQVQPDGKVVNVVDVEEQDPRAFVVYEECPDCKPSTQSKCRTCFGRGEVKVTRRLPAKR